MPSPRHDFMEVDEEGDDQNMIPEKVKTVDELSK